MISHARIVDLCRKYGDPEVAEMLEAVERALANGAPASARVTKLADAAAPSASELLPPPPLGVRGSDSGSHSSAVGQAGSKKRVSSSNTISAIVVVRIREGNVRGGCVFVVTLPIF